MTRRLMAVAMVSWMVSAAQAQRDAPVWECYLPRLSIFHGQKSDLTFDLLFKKEGGPHEHFEHQMYLLGYLKQDEKEVLAISRDLGLLDKDKKGAKLFLDVLLEKKLVTVLATKVGKRGKFAAQDGIGNYRVESEDLRGKGSFKLNTMPFEFNLSNQELFKAFSSLKNFDPKRSVERDDVAWYDDKMKVLVYVPVNDCKYANKVDAKLQKTHDFANYTYNQELEGKDGLLYRETPILYLKPLPYMFDFKEFKAKKRYMVYIN